MLRFQVILSDLGVSGWRQRTTTRVVAEHILGSPKTFFDPFFQDYFGLLGFPLLFQHLVCPASHQAPPPLPLGTGEVVAIMIPEPKGREVVSLLERNVTVTMTITIGTRNLQKYVSRTSVVFVSISFIVLMIISLAWLVFYYIQRFRYANARDRNQVRTKKP